MKKSSLTRLLIIGSAFWIIFMWTDSIAQEADYELAYSDILGKLRRPPVNFSHENHSDALADAGCGVCHHVPDDQTGQLLYIEGEELSCQDCHLQKKDRAIPALREAFHGSCTKCHRQFIKDNKPKTGPTTCGGCHIKQ